MITVDTREVLIYCALRDVTIHQRSLDCGLYPVSLQGYMTDDMLTYMKGVPIGIYPEGHNIKVLNSKFSIEIYNMSFESIYIYDRSIQITGICSFYTKKENNNDDDK